MQPLCLTGPTLKTNLHTHTTFSDGTFTLAQVVAAYEALEYDVLAITDHNRWQDHTSASTGRVLVLSSNEPSLAQREHLLALGVHQTSPVDAGERDRSSSRTQEVIDWINEQSGFSVLNHPAWSGMPVDRLLELERYHAIEVCNAGCTGHGSEFSLTHWDELLRRGRRVWGLATDDSHYDWDRGLGWVELFCERTEAAVIRALHEGRFYATMGPRFEHIECDGETLRLRCDPVMGIAVLSEQGPIKVVHGGFGTVDGLEWKLPDRGHRYVRVELHRADGKKAWSNPIWAD
ncbi:MAG: PHP domain-containing protein [Candidatus Latescibacteria bacterium]|nr:PHP domain-containing protein [Candidatus Latescibacterota bacterium]